LVLTSFFINNPAQAHALLRAAVGFDHAKVDNVRKDREVRSFGWNLKLFLVLSWCNERHFLSPLKFADEIN
jgi:hypothetical protein